MSDYRFGDEYKLSIYPKEAIGYGGELDMDKVESVEIEWVDFIRKPDDKSRWFQLFGTPERAARTLESMPLDSSVWCRYDEEGKLACRACPYEFDPYGCCDSMPLLEWLRGDAE